jgi:serine O-acetyltransferase
MKKERGAFSVDLDKYYSFLPKKSFGSVLKMWLINYGLHCVCCYRFGQAVDRLYARNKLLGFFPVVFHRISNQRMIVRHHVEINKQAKIGKGLIFVHFSGIFIGPVSIGDNCTIHHNVTIGQRVAAGDQGVPTIGRNVWIGPGAIITGAIKIGNNVTISAGSVVSKDVPDDCLVGGNPGRVIIQGYDNSAMLNFKVPEPETAKG